MFKRNQIMDINNDEEKSTIIVIDGNDCLNHGELICVWIWVSDYSTVVQVLASPKTEELISRPVLDENRFRLVSQDRMSA